MTAVENRSEPLSDEEVDACQQGLRLRERDVSVLIELLGVADPKTGVVAPFTLTAFARRLGLGSASGRRTLGNSLARLSRAGIVRCRVRRGGPCGTLEIPEYKRLTGTSPKPKFARQSRELSRELQGKFARQSRELSRELPPIAASASPLVKVFTSLGGGEVEGRSDQNTKALTAQHRRCIRAVEAKTHRMVVPGSSCEARLCAVADRAEDLDALEELIRRSHDGDLPPRLSQWLERETAEPGWAQGLGPDPTAAVEAPERLAPEDFRAKMAQVRAAAGTGRR